MQLTKAGAGSGTDMKSEGEWARSEGPFVCDHEAFRAYRGVVVAQAMGESTATSPAEQGRGKVCCWWDRGY